MLLIDIGNTRVKAARWSAGESTALPALATHAPKFDIWQQALVLNPPLTRALIANVAGAAIGNSLAAFIRSHCGIEPEFVRTRLECNGMRTAYRDPAQLGVDRWLAALAAFSAERAAVCVIDAGTALTVDIVDANGLHLGGMIAPGPELMRESLVRGTAQLASGGIEQVDAFADNTADAISLGCGDATRGLLHCVAQRLEAHAPGTHYRWYLTGGGAPLVAALLDRQWVQVPDLVLRGLAVVAGVNP